MISSPQDNGVAFRLSGYVEELQLLFRRHDQSTGSPSDLQAGTLSFSENDTLRDELSATLRSIVYREREQVTEDDLTTLLMASLTDEPGAAVSAASAEPRRRVQNLLATALRSFWRSAPGAPYRSRLSKDRPQPKVQPAAAKPLPTAERLEPAAALSEIERPAFLSDFCTAVPSGERSEPASEAHLRVPETLVAKDFCEPISLDDTNMASNQDAVAREVARMLAEDQPMRGARQGVGPMRVVEEVRVVETRELARDPEPVPSSTRPAMWPKSIAAIDTNASEPVLATRQTAWTKGSPDDQFAEAMLRINGQPAATASTRSINDGEMMGHDQGDFPEYRSLPFLRPEHRKLWIVGLCCLLLGLAAGLLARGRHGSQENTIVNQDAVPAHTSQLKPSPYGLPSPSVPAPAAAAPSHAPREGLALPAAPQDRAAADDEAAPPVRVEGRNTAQAPTARYISRAPDDLTADVQDAGSDPGSVASPRPVSGTSSSPSGSVYLSVAGVMASNLVAAPAPTYPAQASAAGVQGRVVVQALVGRDGHVLDAHVTSGDQRLREAALEAVSRWRYRPFLQDGRPAEVETLAILDFRLVTP